MLLMIKRTLALCLFLSCLLLACREKAKDPLVNAWIYNDEQTEEQRAENRSFFSGYKTPYFTSANFLDLQPDSTYTGYLNFFDHGKWYFKRNLLILVNHKKKITEFQLNKVNKEELVVTHRMTGNLYRFYGKPNDFKSDAENPFSLVNNRWRIKADHKESDVELRARLKNHFRFWQTYFNWGKEKGLSNLDISTASLIKIYGNGVKLEYYEYLFPDWRNLFYDTTDCRTAYEMLYYKMYEKDIAWPKTENRFEFMEAAFSQMQRWMDEPTSKYVGQK
jgi:hypothetical protein